MYQWIQRGKVTWLSLFFSAQQFGDLRLKSSWGIKKYNYTYIAVVCDMTCLTLKIIKSEYSRFFWQKGMRITLLVASQQKTLIEWKLFQEWPILMNICPVRGCLLLLSVSDYGPGSYVDPFMTSWVFSPIPKCWFPKRAE